MYLSIHGKVLEMERWVPNREQLDSAVDSLRTLKDRQFQTFRHLDLQNDLTARMISMIEAM